jgi:hypothetical protein
MVIARALEVMPSAAAATLMGFSGGNGDSGRKDWYKVARLHNSHEKGQDSEEDDIFAAQPPCALDEEGLGVSGGAGGGHVREKARTDTGARTRASMR